MGNQPPAPAPGASKEIEMTKRFLVVLAVLPMLARAAELSPGVVEVTGSSQLGFTSSSSKLEGSSESSDTKSYGVDATGVYYLTPNVGLGLRLGYASLEDTVRGVTDTTRGTTIGPAIALELPLQEKLALAALGSIAYATSRYSSTDPAFGASVDASGWDFQLGGGLKYYVVPAFSLNGGVGYRHTKLDYDGQGRTRTTYTTSGFGLNVGFSVYFGR